MSSSAITEELLSEPLLTYIMPLYAIGSWYCLCRHYQTGKHLFAIAFFGWIWAGINIVNSKRLDLGIISFGLVILASIWERCYGFHKGVRIVLTISCLLVAVNYSLVLIFWKSIREDLATAKSQVWLYTFLSYCTSMTIFWMCAAHMNQGRGEISSTVSRNDVSYDSVLQ